MRLENGKHSLIPKGAEVAHYVAAKLRSSDHERICSEEGSGRSPEGPSAMLR